MNGVIGDTLPAALTIFISPMPITALILLLLSRRGVAPAVAYAAGWVLGITLEVVGFTALGGIVISLSPDASAVVGGIVDFAVAITLLALAYIAWRRHPTPGEEATLPGWMNTIDRMSPWGALALALVFAIFSPVNLSVTAEAGATIAAATLGFGLSLVAVVIFVLLGTASITGPVVAFALARNRVRAPLEALRAWLVQHNSIVLTTLLLIVGVNFLGKGIGAFWG